MTDLIGLLVRLGAAEIPHSGATLLDHLVGTYDLLLDWGAPDATCVAGLFHSVYGTPRFKQVLTDDRELIKDAIGPEAESLVWKFSKVSNFGEIDGALALIWKANRLEQDRRLS